MNTIKKIYKKFPIIISLVQVFSIMELLHYLRHALPFNSLTNNLISEALSAIIVLAIIGFMTGFDELKYSSKGFGYTFKLCWFILLYTGLLAVLGIFSKIYRGQAITDPIIVVIECAIFALFVGLFEEGLYRGIFLSSLLARLGGTRKGLIISIILAALLFGFIHIYTDFFDLFIDPSTFSYDAVGQMIGKVISTGIFGFVLSVAYIRTHNLWGVAIVHAINDFGGFLADYLFNSNEQIGNYVNTGMPGILTIVGYFGEAIIMIPLIIYVCRQIRNIPLPQYGLLEERWSPIRIEKAKSNRF